MFDILNGVRVLDVTTIVLGPYATQMLGDFGADVIKIESPDGDLFRTVRPGRSAKMGAGFINSNRNKRSLTLNLKTEEGKQLFYRLVKTADVVVHNMRNKTAIKLGIGYEDIKAHNSEIIYCTAQGYGEAGPLSDAPAYDDIIQAASGFAHLNADAQGNPRYAPTILADKVTAHQLAFAIMGGLIQKFRTGKGCRIETPMFEGLVSFLMVEQFSNQSFVPSVGGTGYERMRSPHRRPYPTKDGFIALLPYSTKHWLEFFDLVDHPELAELEIVTDPVKRSENIDQLYEKILEFTPAKTTDQWCELLGKTDIPHTRVNKLDDLLTDEHLNAVNFFEEYEHPTEGAMRRIRSPFTMQGVEQSDDIPTPNLGEANESILKELGLNAEAIKQLEEKGVIGPNRAVQEPS